PLEDKSYGDWYREVVQRDEGFRLYRAVRRLQGCLRAHLERRARWAHLAEGRPEGVLRAPAGTERQGLGGEPLRPRLTACVAVPGLLAGAANVPTRPMPMNDRRPGGGHANRRADAMSKSARSRVEQHFS